MHPELSMRLLTIRRVVTSGLGGLDSEGSSFRTPLQIMVGPLSRKSDSFHTQRSRHFTQTQNSSLTSPSKNMWSFETV
jgi:hypothetical protein